VVGRLGCSAGQGPGSVDAGEATTDQVAQVQRRGAPLEPGVVVDGAAVAQLDPLPALAGDLGDDPLDVRPVVAVVLAQRGVGCPVGSGGAQQVVVFVQDQGATGLRGGAPGAQRALPAQRSEVTDRPADNGRVCPAGQVTTPAASSTVKSSTVNPPATAGATGLGLITAWSPDRSIASRRSPVP
jgi:hypothetical protein